MRRLSERWKGTTPIIKWVLAGGIALAVALAAYSVHVHHLQGRNESYPPSWEDIQDIVNTNTQWVEYKKGGELLNAIESGAAEYPLKDKVFPFSDSDMQNHNAICFRVQIDFLRTLTRAQVEMLKDSDLPFSELSPNQRWTLYRPCAYEAKSSHDLENSYIHIVIEQVGIQDPYLIFLWYIKTSDGRHIDFARNNFWQKNVEKYQQPW